VTKKRSRQQKAPMNAAKRNSIRRNLFHAALPSVEPWDGFDWHQWRGHYDTDKPHSSQALAIDVFGSLQQLSCRDTVLNAFMSRMGYESNGAWTVDLEWRVPGDLLGESGHPTQVDAMASSRNLVVFFECKLTEKQAGSCSHAKRITEGPHEGKRQCNGRYELQTNPTNGKSATCSLAGIGIKYWDYIPRLLEIDHEEASKACPFKGEDYQWMRNVVACAAKAEKDNKKGVFFVVYADLPEERGVSLSRCARESWPRFRETVKPGTIDVGEVSYLDLLDVATEAAGTDADVIRELRSWVEDKARRAASHRS